MKFPTFVRIQSRRLAPLLTAAVVVGCAYAPGMYVGDSLAVKDGTASANVQDAPPPGRLTTITPELIRQQRAGRSTDVAPEVRRLFDQPKPYQIGPGDVLNIVVWDHPELSIAAAGSLATDAGSLAAVGNGHNVSPQGLIQFPFVGTLKLSGLTEYEARDLLTERLAKYIKNPQITLRIQSYRAGRVYLDGEVRTPGLLSLNDIPMTLPEAIGRAGGMTALADRSAIAITRNGTTTMINLVQLAERGINPSNVLLSNADMVRVLSREDAKVFVLGEVLRPVTQNLRNGRLTLNEALGDSGGVNPASGDPRQIFVVRASGAEQAQIYHLDARSPAAFVLAEGFELQARDVIYVDPVPAVRWNRVISLILPSAQAVSTTQSIVR
jgi:polysaccharide export outer membrane protein